MARPTAVIDVVGLSASLLTHAPRISALASSGARRTLRPVPPAVTCPVQASMLTGRPPGEHGIVGNGWFDRTLGEVQFWKQSNRLVGAGKVWETARARDPSVTCANVCWWFNMHTSADFAVTPRPIYRADGRKIPDCWSQPADLRPWLTAELGRFPLFHFWGPAADIRSSRWIADAAKLVHERHAPTLSLVYLPHLDYGLQKLGPDHPDIAGEVRAVDEVAGDLADFYEARDVRVIVLSEYGIEPVEAPVHVNRALREDGGLRVRDELGLELLDPAASDFFAVADHQVAHVYVRDPADVPRVLSLCAGVDGVESVLDRDAQAACGLAHERSGDLVLVAAPGRWFTYYYWLDDARAPDFARTVDIHRKPGYDPVELFIDPRLRLPRLRIAGKLLKRALGARALLDVIPLDASLVRGSHGRTETAEPRRPLLIGRALPELPDPLPCTAVRDVILHQLFG